MTTEFNAGAAPSAEARLRGILEWAPVALGLLVLYVPTFVDLTRTMWQTDEHAHGPIILAISLWIFWSKRHSLVASESVHPSLGVGLGLLVFGLAAYALGRSQDIIVLEVGSILPVVCGAVVMLRGYRAVASIWFALLFIVFLLPLPGFVVDTLTLPLKAGVSDLAEKFLYFFGYPIARNGVVLTIGSYQLLVADACSGLNSMFSLLAIGLVYVYITKHPSRIHNALLLASILPIAFGANVVRVIVLVLVTYHFGDAAGQGTAHGLSGMVLFVAAVMLLLTLDSFLRLVSGLRAGRTSVAPVAPARTGGAR